MDENKKLVEGTPIIKIIVYHYHTIQKYNMLKIHNSIPMQHILESATDSELNSVLKLG